MCGHTALQSLPLSITPRITRRKCVSGNASPMNCAQPGMPRNGNMKPDSSSDGRKKKKVICIACIWLCATLEIVMPTVRLAPMKISTPSSSSARLPSNGTLNT